MTARVLPVDTDGRVLLLHGWDPAARDRPFWFTIGGAAEPAESMVDAAARELREETGMVVEPTDLGEPVATHQHKFGWDGWILEQSETYFALRATVFEVSFAGLEPIEQDTIDQADWWQPGDLETAGTAGFTQLPGPDEGGCRGPQPTPAAGSPGTLGRPRPLT